MSQRRQGFTLVELLVSTAVSFITVLAVTAAFLGYNQAAYNQAGLRGAQSSLRQAHQQVMRQLRMAGYGLEPVLAFGFPAGWSDDASRNRSDRLVFRMRDPAFGVSVASVSAAQVLTAEPLPELLRRGQVVQVVCPGAMAWSYAQLSADAAAGVNVLDLEPATGAFPRLNVFSLPCYSGTGGLRASVFKVEVYDYSIQLIDDDGVAGTPPRPYLFRRHGLDESSPAALGEPVAEDIEALRVTFLREDGTPFIPDATAPAPDYETPADDSRRTNDNPANIRGVRVGLVSRSSTADVAARGSGLLNLIPGFAGRPDLAGPPGFRRVLAETTIQVRNLRSSEMFVSPRTTDTTPGVCQGVAPADGLGCAGG